MLDAAGEDVPLHRPQRVLLALDDQDLNSAEHEAELLVLVAVQRNDRSWLELDQVQHRAVPEQGPTRDAGHQLEGPDVVEVDELRFHAPIVRSRMCTTARSTASKGWPSRSATTPTPSKRVACPSSRGSSPGMNRGSSSGRTSPRRRGRSSGTWSSC